MLMKTKWKSFSVSVEPTTDVKAKKLGNKGGRESCERKKIKKEKEKRKDK
jgi:hypothetical protein